MTGENAHETSEEINPEAIRRDIDAGLAKRVPEVLEKVRHGRVHYPVGARDHMLDVLSEIGLVRVKNNEYGAAEPDVEYSLTELGKAYLERIRE